MLAMVHVSMSQNIRNDLQLQNQSQEGGPKCRGAQGPGHCLLFLTKWWLPGKGKQQAGGASVSF